MGASSLLVAVLLVCVFVAGASVKRRSQTEETTTSTKETAKEDDVEVQSGVVEESRVCNFETATSSSTLQKEMVSAETAEASKQGDNCVVVCKPQFVERPLNPSKALASGGNVGQNFCGAPYDMTHCTISQQTCEERTAVTHQGATLRGSWGSEALSFGQLTLATGVELSAPASSVSEFWHCKCQCAASYTWNFGGCNTVLLPACNCIPDTTPCAGDKPPAKDPEDEVPSSVRKPDLDTVVGSDDVRSVPDREEPPSRVNQSTVEVETPKKISEPPRSEDLEEPKSEPKLSEHCVALKSSCESAAGIFSLDGEECHCCCGSQWDAVSRKCPVAWPWTKSTISGLPSLVTAVKQIIDILPATCGHPFMIGRVCQPVDKSPKGKIDWDAFSGGPLTKPEVSSKCCSQDGECKNCKTPLTPSSKEGEWWMWMKDQLTDFVQDVCSSNLASCSSIQPKC